MAFFKCRQMTAEYHRAWIATHFNADLITKFKILENIIGLAAIAFAPVDQRQFGVVQSIGALRHRH